MRYHLTFNSTLIFSIYFLNRQNDIVLEVAMYTLPAVCYQQLSYEAYTTDVCRCTNVFA